MIVGFIFSKLGLKVYMLFGNIIIMPEAFKEEIKGGAEKEQIKEEIRKREPAQKMSKGSMYKAFAKKLSPQQVFNMLSSFKTKIAKGLASLLKKLLG